MIFDVGGGILEITNIIHRRLIQDDKIHFIYGIFSYLVSVIYCTTGKHWISFNLALRSGFTIYLSTEPLLSCADFWCCDSCLVFWVTIAVAKYYLCFCWKYNSEDNVTYCSTNTCIQFALLQEGQRILNAHLLNDQFLQCPVKTGSSNFCFVQEFAWYLQRK